MGEPMPSILIVDDRPEKVLALEAVLEDLNQNIVRAYSGREALRFLLKQDFAVILLDVNMPGMDGFETAEMIRQRASSRHTPIIFITAFGDEIHASRGYSLGAVDYILAPVLPEILRTKVSVFVDLYTKTEQIKQQADTLHRRATQMQKLANASLAINSSLSTEQMLQTIADTARDILQAHQTIVLHVRDGKEKPTVTRAVTSFSEKYSDWIGRELQLDAIAKTLVFQSRSATRMSEADLLSHPDWAIVSRTEIPPIRGGILAAPLTGRDGSTLGVIYLSDRSQGDFTSDDESVLVQLAQMGSVALENTLYAQERQANRIKDEFLATLSHELRTPLNAILSWTQLLQMDNPGEEVAHGLEVIERNARAQTKLIEDLLDVSRIEAGKLTLDLRSAALAAVVQSAVDATKPSADTKEIRLATHIAAADVYLSVDPDRMQQVIWNLLTNAIKFTPKGGEIDVHLSEIRFPAPMLRLEIKDTGQGIDPKFLPFVFDRFRQADSTSTRSHGGLGIGLAIVRHLVERHGGKVSVHSDGLGHGATFTVELPINATSTEIKTSPAITNADSKPRARRSIDGVHVLVVDDEPDSAEAVAVILKQAGALVAKASSAATALELVSTFKPDVLLSDIAMPEEDGYFLIQQLRSNSDRDIQSLPAIALTAYAREEDRTKALAAGFNDHLTKPSEPEKILACIARAASEAGLHAHSQSRALTPTAAVE